MTKPCPGCGRAGEISGKDGLFEVRGRLPISSRPRVRRCRGCGSGFIWQGSQASLLETDFWNILDAYWQTNNLDVLSGIERRSFYYPKDITPEGSVPAEASPDIQSASVRSITPLDRQSYTTASSAPRRRPVPAKKSGSFIDEIAPFVLLGVALLFLSLSIKEFAYAAENASSLARVLAWGYLGAFVVAALGARASYLAGELLDKYSQAVAHTKSLHEELDKLHGEADTLHKQTDSLQKEIEDLHKEITGLYGETDDLYKQIQELGKS